MFTENKTINGLRSSLKGLFFSKPGIKAAKIIILTSILIALASCTSVSVSTGMRLSSSPLPHGSLWNRYKYSQSFTELENAYKKGKSSSHCFFGLIAYGDSSISTAVRNGNIRKIRHIDNRVYSVSMPLNLLPIYEEHVTFVYGE